MTAPPQLTVDQLRPTSPSGEIDTVIVAFTDMQGRLQGKRLHAQYFLDEVLAHGTEGCNYLLAVDVDMNTVDGYAISSWERGYGDMMFVLDLATLRRMPGPAGHRHGAVRPRLARRQRPGARSRRARCSRRRSTRPPSAACAPSPAPSWSSSSSTTPTSRPGTGATRT